MKLFPVITCEHAGNIVPEKYVKLFHGTGDVLKTHRGYDLAALGVAETIANAIHAPLHACQTTRLLIETNRSIGQPDLFSEFTQSLPMEEKNELIRSVYVPYRNAVIETIANANKPVLHLSIHSFTPVWKNMVRNVDIGLLFDPDRNFEWRCCLAMQQSLRDRLDGYLIKFNEPYRGIDDGFTTFLRTKFPDEIYAGIEVEINQKFENKDGLTKITNALIESIDALS